MKNNILTKQKAREFLNKMGFKNKRLPREGRALYIASPGGPVQKIVKLMDDKFVISDI